MPEVGDPLHHEIEFKAVDAHRGIDSENEFDRNRRFRHRAFDVQDRHGRPDGHGDL